MKDGAFFGEIGVFITGKRSTWVKAKTVCIFLTILKQPLIELFNDYPIHLKYLKSVGK